MSWMPFFWSTVRTRGAQQVHTEELIPKLPHKTLRTLEAGSWIGGELEMISGICLVYNVPCCRNCTLPMSFPLFHAFPRLWVQGKSHSYYSLFRW